jgi:two-component system, NtrC family, response regulator AtoC
MARVLIVDDEEGIREFLTEVLETAGHAVTTASTGPQALDAVSKVSFDLLLCDLKLPGLDGLEVLQQVKALDCNVEVVMVTAHGTVATAVEAMKRGAFDFIQKPFSSPQGVSLLVDRALERRSLLREAERREREQHGAPALGYGSAAMRGVETALRRVAPTDATVLLLGASGTGKEVAARTLHRWSRRSSGPFVAINCAALRDQLVESELFGHEKGAFTGATHTHRGRIELAEGGTFFLDEVGELRPEVQAKLLRVLQEQSMERVGGHRSIPVDVRWVAATNRDLERMVGEGTFREDLFHRLAVFPLRLPSLSERREDLPALCRVLLADLGRRLGRPGLELSEDALALIAVATFRGNVRELGNALERAAILSESNVVTSEHLTLRVPDEPDTTTGGKTFEALERAAIVAALAASNGNRQSAALELGIGVRTLYTKLKRYDIR